MYHGLAAQLQQMYECTTYALPPCLHLDRIQDMMEKFKQGYFFLPMDKNDEKLICICRKLYLSCLLSIYQDTAQSQLLHTCDSHADALQMAACNEV